MKNLGIKTKKFVRKITAIASAALMTGLSMGVAAAQLDSLTDTFITSGEFDAYVVLGTGGSSNVVGFAKDVAGAVVVSSAFAQQATTTTSTSGSATLARNLTSTYLNGSYVGFQGSVPSSDSVKTNADTGFSWLPNSTVQNNSNNDVANVTAKLTAATTSFLLGTDGNYTILSDAITYNLTFNSDHGTAGNQAVGNNTKNIPFPYGDYQITNWTASGSGTDSINVTLGDYTEVSSTTGQTYSIGSTGATFEILSYSTSPSDRLKIKVMDSDGTVLYNDLVAKGAEIYSNSDFTLRLDDYAVLSGVVDATVAWTTSSIVLKHNRDDPSYSSWKVKMTNTSSGITSIAWVYSPDSLTELTAGSEKSFFDGHFKMTADAFSINSTDGEERAITLYDAENSNKDLYFVDNETTTHSIDLNLKSGTFGSANQSTVTTWIDSNVFTLTCNSDGSTTNVSLTRGSSYETVTIENDTPFALNDTVGGGNVSGWEIWANMTWAGTAPCTNSAYNLTILNATTDAGNPINDSLLYYLGTSAADTGGWYNVSKTGLNATVQLTENDSQTVTIDYDEGSLGTITAVQGAVLSAAGTEYTYFGTKIVKSSSAIVMYYPEKQKHGSLSLGRDDEITYELTSGEYSSDLDVTLKSGSGSSVAVNNIDVSLSKLDSEITSSTLSKPIILMGGWSVNSLVQDLVDAGSVNSSDLVADRALVQLVSSAFNGQSALVIAGWEGDDTRLAAQVVASQVLGTDMGLTGTKAILNTGVTSYSDVTVV